MRIILLAAAVAALGVCANALAQAEEKISDGVVRLGLIVDMSGPFSYLAGEDTVDAARMAVEDFGGQVLGRPIEVVIADHHNKSDIAAAQAREWFESGKVDALMDVTGSPSALAVSRIARQLNRIAIFNTATAARLTNEACTPVTIHWTFDSYALARSTVQELVRTGGDSWYFITADVTAGHALEKDASDAVKGEGGAWLGSSMHALNVADFSSHMLRAQQSGAKVIGLATFGPDLLNAVKAARQIGVDGQGKQRLAALLMYIDDVHKLGLAATQGLYLSEAFYWNMSDASRAWSQRFFERRHKMPNMTQAGVYSGTMHYLKAVQAAGTDRTEDVMSRMREHPVDFFGVRGRIREDGRMVHEMYLFEVKKPDESSGPWDYYKLRATVPAEQAFLPLDKSACPLLANH